MPGAAITQLFLRDPIGTRVELTFLDEDDAGGEPAAAAG